jgi:hypothetical protein
LADGCLILWDPASGNKRKEWQLPGPIGKAYRRREPTGERARPRPAARGDTEK